MKSHDLFISHSSKDVIFVRQLAEDLKKSGFNIWLAEWEMIVGDSWAIAVSNAIRSSHFVLIIMSPDYFASDWAQQEWHAAMLQEMQSRQVKVIPIMYRDCEVPGLLKGKVWIDFRNRQNYSASLQMLISGLKNLGSSDKPNKVPDDPPKVGQRPEALDPSQMTELTKVLKEAVDAFKSKPETQISETMLPSSNIIEKDLCFIVMPFGSADLNIVYEDFVKPTLEETCGLRAERGDDVFGSNVIMDDIRKSIMRARLIIADLTGRNANVFYEVGIAHTMNKLVLLLAQSIDDVPFDLRHRRVLLYEYSPRGCKKLERDLKANVDAILRD